MKKTVKIFASIFVLVIALSSILIFATSADGESATAPVVVSANINYRGSFGIMLAIDSSTVKDGKVTVEFTYDGKTSTVTDTTPKTIAKLDPKLEKTYYVLESPGIPAADMDKEVTYTVTDGANNQSTGTISVAEYFFKRLFVNGIIEATEGPDYDRRDFYIYTLGFGAKAQNILYNYDNDDTNNIADGEYVTDLKSYTLNGKMVGIYDNSTTVSDPLPAYTGEVPAGKRFGGYTVTKYDADNDYAKTVTTAAVGDTITIDQHTVVTPAFVELEGGDYFKDTNIIGTRIDGDNLLASFQNQHTSSNATLSMKNGKLEYANNNAGYCSGRFTHSESIGEEETPIFVFEADMIVTDGNAQGKTIANIYFAAGGKEGNIKVESWSTNAIICGKNLTLGEEYNLRFELNLETGELNYFIDGTLSATQTVALSDSSSAHVRFVYDSSYGNQSAFTFDNVFIGVIDNVAVSE